MPGDPFEISSLPDASLRRRVTCAAAKPLLSWLLQWPRYRALLQQTRLAPRDRSFEMRALDALDIRPTCAPADAALIPTHGPLVIAANHPHGAADGLVLASLVRRRRSDARILANHLLSRIPELADLCFFVDPFRGPAAASRSCAGLRAAHVWLKQGGALIVFPAGEVAHDRQAGGSYSDSPWTSTTGRMVLATGATVVPAFIAGRNGTWFYAAGRVHASFRTALLARELLKMRGQDLAVRFGPPLSSAHLALVAADAVGVTQSIRDAVLGLAETVARKNDAPPAGSAEEPVNRTTFNAETAETVEKRSGYLRDPGERCLKTSSRFRCSTTRDDVGVDAIESDIGRLPAEACLVDSGACQVFCARARQIPSALREIGYLREATYRAVGEGTRRSLDLDEFDQQYLHLFSWDRARRQIVGAYRIGQTDRIMAAEGVAGLYTRTLFRYDERLIGVSLRPWNWAGRLFARNTRRTTRHCSYCGKGSASSSFVTRTTACSLDR
ncbi:MAG: lysophospholipid acyltransferase family protein [Acidobacteriota bacterium]